MQPRTKATVRQSPDWAKVSATSPLGLTISVDVKNTIRATGMRITAIVRNWRLR